MSIRLGVLILTFVFLHGSVLTETILTPYELGKWLSRSKRSIDLRDASTECTLKCLTMNSTEELVPPILYKTVGESPLNPGMTEFESNNGTHLMPIDQLCSGYPDTRDCIQACEDSDLKEAVTKSFGTFDFLCVRHADEFEEYRPCLAPFWEGIHEGCNTTCTEQRDEMMAAMAPLPVDSMDTNETSCIYDETCTMIACAIDCAASQINSTCGDSASTIMHEYMHRVTMSLLDVLIEPDLKYALPVSCDSLLNFKITK